MPSIAALCNAAKLDRNGFNNLRNSRRNAGWGDEQSEGFALRIGLFAALKSIGVPISDAVDHADTLANLDKLPKWMVRNALDDEVQFFSSSTFAQWTIAALIGVMTGGEGEQVGEDEPVRVSINPPSIAISFNNLHSVRDRMLALFK